jgi:hypothetical protein
VAKSDVDRIRFAGEYPVTSGNHMHYFDVPEGYRVVSVELRSSDDDDYGKFHLGTGAIVNPGSSVVNRAYLQSHAESGGTLAWSVIAERVKPGATDSDVSATPTQIV